MPNELKPCPFCGKDPKLQEDIRYPRPKCEAKRAYEVICENWDCPIHHADTYYSLSKKKAIEAWNRRVSNVKKENSTN